MKKPNLNLGEVRALVAGRRFWWFVLALLVLQAAWIALSGKYPLAFDEDFHLGIIKLYAHHISPFWAHQPENADTFGAVARDPSYLYQYLMSFPYRLLRALTSNQGAIVIMLRFINIGLFACCLVLFRKLLLKLNVSRAAVHFCLLLFVLLPVVPQLAAQINYDNLWLPMVALALLITIRLDGAIFKRKRIDAGLLAWLVIVCLLASLVKYAFLPIMVAIAGFLLVRFWQVRAEVKPSTLLISWRDLSVRLRVALMTGLIIATALFAQRIGFNLVKYHSPVPDCNKVLSIEACSEYGPWIRDYNFKLNKVSSSKSPVAYTGNWFYGMWLRTFFAVGGPYSDFETRGPLPIPGISAIVFVVLGITALALGFRQMLRKYEPHVVWLFLVTSGVYLAFLWLDEYMAWVRTGQPVAINGRYLLPVLPLIMILMIAGVTELFQKRPRLQLGLATAVVLSLAWGGGALTFILRSNDGWYWDNSAVRTANHVVRDVVGPITPGYHDPVQFLK